MDGRSRRPSNRASAPLRAVLLLLAALLQLLSASTSGQTGQASQTHVNLPERLSAAEFSRIVQEFSEDGGYFHSDNFTSNETSYLSIVDKLRELTVSGGAYIGVGPEQNFTYIAKIHPRIAFIIDIRRQAVIQHLMYKAIFQLSDHRTQFLSRLLSRPLQGPNAPGRDASVHQLMQYFSDTAASAQAYNANLAQISKTIREDFKIPLSAKDQDSLAYVSQCFRDAGLGISFQMAQWGPFPTLRDLIEQPDPHGNPGNYLASEEDYGFVRDLQRRNRIIPVVGDFAGPKALKAIGGYLQHESYVVSAFYTSNVEQFLFQNGAFGAFAENVTTLPVNANSVFIRAVPNRGRWYGQAPAARMGVLLQHISDFVADNKEDFYTNYWELLSTHSIAPDPR